MAGFAARSLALFASSVVTPLKQVSWYTYATPDANATVLAAGYFNNAREKLKVNDVILCVSVANGVGVLNALTVTAVPATGNVTVDDSFAAPA